MTNRLNFKKMKPMTRIEGYKREIVSTQRSFDTEEYINRCLYVQRETISKNNDGKIKISLIQLFI